LFFTNALAKPIKRKISGVENESPPPKLNKGNRWAAVLEPSVKKPKGAFVINIKKASQK
jgi:hypothetical protein